MPRMCPKEEIGGSPWEWACRLDLTGTVRGQRAALTLICFGTSRQLGWWEGRTKTWPGFPLYKQQREGLKKPQAQFKVNTLFLPDTFQRLTLEQWTFNNSAFTFWPGLDKLWPEGRNGHKGSHPHPGEESKRCFNRHCCAQRRKVDWRWKGHRKPERSADIPKATQQSKT